MMNAFTEICRGSRERSKTGEEMAVRQESYGVRTSRGPAPQMVTTMLI